MYVLDPDILFSLAVTGFFSLSEHKSLESILQIKHCKWSKEEAEKCFSCLYLFIKNTIGTTDHEPD